MKTFQEFNESSTADKVGIQDKDLGVVMDRTLRKHGWTPKNGGHDAGTYVHVDHPGHGFSMYSGEGGLRWNHDDELGDETLAHGNDHASLRGHLEHFKNHGYWKE